MVRYAPLVWSVCNRYQLNRTDINDIGQTVWLLLVERLGEPARVRRAARLAGHHHPAGMPSASCGRPADTT